jgi:hypothetical protein
MDGGIMNIPCDRELTIMNKALGSVPSTTRKKERKRENEMIWLKS